ncbi:serpentine type 7TM GPCR chemoreceptor srw domain-containing protein [Ditylenchus destructor]|nr:serpentine type 7TM GPCR chemoreceptor srw domain-containing protein [Ditylenchus destructor]
MASCSGLDAETIEQARAYYNELLSETIGWYDSFIHQFIYQVLCLIGVIANVCIVVVLLRPPMRKNPFNLFLIAIAICDLTLMASYFIYKQVELCHPWYFEFAWIIFTYAYAVLSVFVHSASLWMTVNMAVLRYLVLRNSASSGNNNLNTYSAATISVVAAVAISLIGSAPNMLRYQIQDNGMLAVPEACLSNASRYAHFYAKGQQVHAYTLSQPAFWSCSWERFSFWTAGLMLKIIPCILLTVFMTLLVRMLMEARERRLRLCRGAAIPTNAVVANNTSPNNTCATTNVNNTCGHQANAVNRQTQAERTTAMLTIIVAVFLITELPQGILVLAIGVQPQVRFAMHQLGNVIDLLSLLNSSVNFILYATMSNVFRHEFLQTFGGCCPSCPAAIRRWIRELVGRRRLLFKNRLSNGNGNMAVVGGGKTDEGCGSSSASRSALLRPFGGTADNIAVECITISTPPQPALMEKNQKTQYTENERLLENGEGDHHF